MSGNKVVAPAYNVQTLSFLISSFKNMAATVGQNSKTVELYKQQVGMMINIGQIGQAEAELINELIGMKNTNAVKWQSAEKHIEQFIFAMNTITKITTITDDALDLILSQMEQAGNISTHVREIISKIYKLKMNQVTTNTMTGFGNIQTSIDAPNNKTANNTAKTNNNKQGKKFTTEKEIKAEFEMIRMYGDCGVRVRNSEAVCSNDRVSYTFKFDDILSNNMYELLEVSYGARELAKGSKFEAGTITEYSDCSSHYIRVEEIDAIKELVENIDWKVVKRMVDKRYDKLRNSQR